jgi:NAD(P)-dependent dehydrogenase (short-subunit alcohol dehydrogenase family)
MGVLDLFDLRGQTAVVTGGGSGLGRDMALALADAGANIVVPDVVGDLAEETAARVRALGRRALAMQVDVADAEAVARCFNDAERNFGGVDILVNNAAMGSLGASVDVPMADWQRVLDVNVNGVFLCARHAARQMLVRRRGKIVNIASVYGLVGTDARLYVHGDPAMVHQAIAYNTSKGAVISLTRSLAVEWAPHGIQVNAIAPGMMRVERVRPGLPDVAWQRLAERTPAGRAGVAHDLFGALLFLASAASDFVTGHVLVVDGGWTAW